MSLYNKIFGDPNEKYIKQLWPLVYEIKERRSIYKEYSNEQLREMTLKLKERLAKGETLDDILVDAFAVVREAADRVLGVNERLAYSAINDVQMLGAIVIHRKQIAEMKTGEGKTRVAVPAVYLNSLSGKGVHMITVNDYLAKRDTLWMGRVYDFLGLSISCLQNMSAFKLKPSENFEIDDVQGFSVEKEQERLEPVDRRTAYQSDVLYGTNSEFGFDYLRDNMVHSNDRMVQKPLHFAVIDEIDSVLIDEARTPLIISAGAEESSEKYQLFSKLVKTLIVNEDFNVDEKMRAATLTDAGIAKLEKALGVENIYVEAGISTVHHIEQALRAETIFKLDKDYVVKDGEILIVDEFTGRLMKGRRYSEGLHQAIEAKEGVEVKQESQTLATITIQNYFRMYEKLAGMTGTAATEAEEFSKIYSLEVTIIPTNRPCIRKDLQDRIYGTELGKYKAIIKEIKERTKNGQPVLVGTISIERNELLHEFLKREGIKHEILNAKNHVREAEIIAQAGRVGAVTIATNMAGRGVDIVLGGNPVNDKEMQRVLDAGGLYVIGTERHESRRIDNQLRGRSGRQGDPGESQFYVSLEDDLMRIFGSMDRMKKMMVKLGMPDDMSIENKVISKSIESAQHKVEGNNFDIRKHVLEYDDVINKHRDVIYKKRKEILDIHENNKENLSDKVVEMIENEIETVVTFHTASEDVTEWNKQEIFEVIKTIIPLDSKIKEILEINETSENQKLPNIEKRKNIINALISLIKENYNKLKQAFKEISEEENILPEIEKNILLSSIDSLWIEHLEAMDHIKTGIRLQGYAQKDPLVEYKKEGFRMFNELMALIQKQVVYSIFKISGTKNVKSKSLLNRPGVKLSASAKSNNTTVKPSVKNLDGSKVGRNDLCPCGSGKKYKKCCGKGV